MFVIYWNKPKIKYYVRIISVRICWSIKKNFLCIIPYSEEMCAYVIRNIAVVNLLDFHVIFYSIFTWKKKTIFFLPCKCVCIETLYNSYTVLFISLTVFLSFFILFIYIGFHSITVPFCQNVLNPIYFINLFYCCFQSSNKINYLLMEFFLNNISTLIE